jgi:adenylate cyclase
MKTTIPQWLQQRARHAERPEQRVADTEVQPDVTSAVNVAVTRGSRRAAVRLSASYAAGLALAHLAAAAAVAMVIISLSKNTIGDASRLLTEKNLIAASGLVVMASVVGAVAGVLGVLPSVRWFALGQEPNPAQQRAAIRIAHRQTAVHFATWAASGAVLVLLNLDSGSGVVCVIGAGLLFGGATTSCIGYLVTQRALRPVIAVAMRTATADTEIPGVLARLMITWVLFSTLPIAGIAVILLASDNGWFVPKSAPVKTPVLILAALSLVVGIRAMALVARSISDPIHNVVEAMAEVEHGHSPYVAVYEPSEIGRLQSGFNQMVAGLVERERLRDLFGRHVGADVARQALEQEAALLGDIREVAVLFVDIVGSTALAAARPPREVAEILNEFFGLVFEAVDDRQGLINKFQGDAALAVFGAPLRIEDPASAALSTARALASKLGKLLPTVDFGVGVSVGSVFAGNVGAEYRYEYTVIGDPVNEAARLADHAKQEDSRILASGSAIARAGAAERRHWVQHGSAVLRGRLTATELAVPRNND